MHRTTKYAFFSRIIDEKQKCIKFTLWLKIGLMTLEQKRARVLRRTPLYYAPIAPVYVFYHLILRPPPSHGLKNVCFQAGCGADCGDLRRVTTERTRQVDTGGLPTTQRCESETMCTHFVPGSVWKFVYTFSQILFLPPIKTKNDRN